LELGEPPTERNRTDYRAARQQGTRIRQWAGGGIRAWREHNGAVRSGKLDGAGVKHAVQKQDTVTAYALRSVGGAGGGGAGWATDSGEQNSIRAGGSERGRVFKNMVEEPEKVTGKPPARQAG